MRKLLSIGALAAASLLATLQPAMAGQPVVIVRPNHHHYYRHNRYRDHGRSYREYRDHGRTSRGYRR